LDILGLLSGYFVFDGAFVFCLLFCAVLP
jgi:hypothetical protein